MVQVKNRSIRPGVVKRKLIENAPVAPKAPVTGSWVIMPVQLVNGKSVVPPTFQEAIEWGTYVGFYSSAEYPGVLHDFAAYREMRLEEEADLHQSEPPPEPEPVRLASPKKIKKIPPVSPPVKNKNGYNFAELDKAGDLVPLNVVAKVFGLNPKTNMSTIYAWVKQGKLPPTIQPGRRKFIPKAALIKYLQSL